jgi:hypothetical protein
MDALVRHSLPRPYEPRPRVHHLALAPEAFIAGLLHNLGVTQLKHPAGVSELISTAALPEQDMPALEATSPWAISVRAVLLKPAARDAGGGAAPPRADRAAKARGWRAGQPGNTL